jgi:DNA-binding NtrC family response regulator
MNSPAPRILIIDDDPAVLGLMRETLEQRGYQPQALTSSREAVSLLEQQAFDLIISDIVMPDPHGLKILEIAKRRQPQTPVIFITGHAHRQIVKESYEKGAYAIVEKPFQIPKFMTTVEGALDRSRQSGR